MDQFLANISPSYKKKIVYIQKQINKIRNSVEDRQSWFACQTVNEVSGRKDTSKAKLRSARQEERNQKWKEHFKNLLGNSIKVTDKPIKIK